METVHQQKLEKMLQEGKITQEDYENLKINLPDPDSSLMTDQPSLVKSLIIKGIPWQVWLCGGLFILIGIIQAFLFGSRFSDEYKYMYSDSNYNHKSILMLLMSLPSVHGLLGALVSIICGWGLIKMNRWIYLITLLLTTASMVAVVFFAKDISVMVVYAVIFGIILSPWKYYWKF
jgi:hypothetical protein